LDSKITFEDLNIKPQFLKALGEAGIIHPSPIQERAIPLIKAGKDVVGIAQTGTGKTFAFLIPLMMKLNFHQGDKPRAIIFAPTKELAVQIWQEFERLNTYSDLKACVVYGGVGITEQIKQIETGIDVIIGTPGRFMDLYRKEVLDLKQVKTLVLDEADRLMDMGFIPQLRQILEVIPVKRQNLLFSATFSEQVEELSHEFLDFPEKIEVTKERTPVESVQQQIFNVPNFRAKLDFLMSIINREDFKQGIVFVNSRHDATHIGKFLSRKMRDDEFRTIHANKSQSVRLNSLRDFKEGLLKVVVATDVSSRGIDVLEMSHVINFNVPRSAEDYVHRIGRTGRAFRTGVSITFCHKGEEYAMDDILKDLRLTLSYQKLPKTIEVVETSKEELIAMDRMIDFYKRKQNPDYKGAFHRKKKKK
jgi:ATP-dependent RNA helicase RhlE